MQSYQKIAQEQLLNGQGQVHSRGIASSSDGSRSSGIAWVETTLERLTVVFITWRITPTGLIALADEWKKIFANWRVTQEAIDLAIEMSIEKWSRVPDNVTREFREMLSLAMYKIDERKHPMRTTVRIKSEQEKRLEANSEVIGKIMKIHGLSGPGVFEALQILNAAVNLMRESYPGETEIQTLRRVWLSLDDLK